MSRPGIAWPRSAQEYLKKGSLVYIEGRLKTDKYEDNGENKYFTKVVALQLQILDRRDSDDSPGLPRMPLPNSKRPTSNRPMK